MNQTRIALATAIGGGAVTAIAALTTTSALSTVALSAVALAAAALAWLTSAPGASPQAVDDARQRLRQRLEEGERQRLALRMRAETAGRFREEFVAAVRHELKTPLNAILGFTLVLQEGIDGPLTDQQAEDVTAIRQAGEYLTELVESVLKEWVPEPSTRVPLGTVDLGLALRDVARLLEGQTVGRPVAIHVETAAGLPRLIGDARRLRQVLINLGTNALRATVQGSVTLRAEPHPDGVCLSVVDTGTGIRPELLSRLFEEFTQGGSPSSQLGGSGLGLALTRDLVECQGGRIEVETMVGHGSTFRVVLPLELD